MGLLDDISYALPGSLPDDKDKADATRMGLLQMGAALMAGRGNLGQVLGQGLLNGATGYKSAYDDATKVKLQNAQMKLLQNKDQREQRLTNIGAQLAGLDSNGDTAIASAPAVNTPAANTLAVQPADNNAFPRQTMPVWLPASRSAQPNAPQIPPQTQTQTQPQSIGLRNLTPDQVAGYKVMGIDIEGPWKVANQGLERKPGSWYIDPYTKQPVYADDPKTGMVFDAATNSFKPIANFGEINAKNEGLKTAAQEEAKSPYTFQTLNLPSGPRVMTTKQASQYMEGTSAGGSAPSPQVAPTPNQQSPATWQKINANFKASEPQNTNDRIAIIQQELQNEKDPGNRAALSRELQRLGAPPNQEPGVALENKDRTAVTNEIAKQRLSTVEKEAQGAQNILGNLDIAERLIRKGVYENGMLDRAALAAHNSGLYTTPQGVNTNQLGLISNNLVLAHGSLGAGVSTADAERYDKAAGDLSRAQTNADRLAAIKTMREIAGRQMDTANQVRQQFAKDGTTPDYQAPPSQQKGGTWADLGYPDQQSVIKDAKNAIFRNPGAKPEVLRRLSAMGITNHGIK